MRRAARLLLATLLVLDASPAFARRLRCHDGTLGRVVVRTRCDVDQTADGACSFAVPCPSCVYERGCRIACAATPRYAGPVVRVGERHVLVGPGHRRLVLRCRPGG